MTEPDVRTGFLPFLGKLAIPVGVAAIVALNPISKEWAVDVVKDYGFHTIFLMFFLWLSTIPWTEIIEERGKRWAPHLPALALAIILTVGIVLASPPKFRIFADEVNLLGMASSMYDHHSYYNPTQLIYFFEGQQNVVTKEWDIRPLGFPLLMYFAHALTGYRPENSLIVNGLMGGMTLFLFYLILQRFVSRLMAVLGMVFLASVPLIVLSITSGGMEIANLCFALMAFYGLTRFLFSPTASNAEFTAYSLLFLSQIRYESILFSGFIFPLLVWKLPPEERPRLSWRIWILPFLFVLPLWHRLIFSAKGRFQIPKDQEMFCWQYFRNHLRPAMNFFLGKEERYGTIAAAFLLMIPAFPILTYQTFFGREKHRELQTLILVGGFAILTYGAIVLAYFMGDLTFQWTTRLGGLFFPFILFPSLVVLHNLSISRPRIMKTMTLLAVASVCWHWPTAGENQGAREITTFRSFHFIQRFLAQAYPDKKILIVSPWCNLFTPFRYSGVAVTHFREQQETILKDLKSHLYRDILLFQEIDRESGKASSDTTPEEKGFSLEALTEMQWTATQILRISRLIPVKEKEKNPTVPSAP